MLCHIAQDQAQYNRSSGEVKLPHIVAYKAKGQHNTAVHKADVNGIGTHHGQHHNNRCQNCIGNFNHIDNIPRGKHTHKAHGNIGNDKANNNGVSNICLIGKQGRAGSQSMDHQTAQQNGSGGATRNTQGDQRN